MTTDSIQQIQASTGITFIERGWLSANNILIRGDGPTALVDSGYWTHAPQTLALVDEASHGQGLDLLLNTHLHSDHCGGNAALQHAHSRMRTLIPPGLAPVVERWDPVALTYEPTGQHCPQFRHDELLQPGESIQLGALEWQIHGAKGHDPHSIVLFQPQHRVLISADALWENGFGVVFPELEGIDAFDEVEETLGIIESLAPRLVLPGHGRPFSDLASALKRAHSRLSQFRADPSKHQRHAWKVLIKYKLLEWQQIELSKLLTWACNTPYLARAMPSGGDNPDAAMQWLAPLLADLVKANAATIEGNSVVNV
ncbi:MAG: MBL fold metallo-hydrolase [Hydrogenophaga sp.]|nr:MBL fold metallo-hydrolase [Hydrogenophaga sp.]